MSRNEFVKSVIRYLLLGALAFIAVFAGSKVVTGADCNSCPGKGICTKKSDCSEFLSKQK